ncbi:MAG TPA: DUF4159 domain-containing protein [Acidobacteriota bacterium]|nr:DUF4159 domain-containing protein [Acidobacteriota bacterium]
MKSWLAFALLAVVLAGFFWPGLADIADSRDPNDPNLFNFVRLRYNGFIGNWTTWGGWTVPWAHDYPRAEQNFLKILAELTTVETTPDSYLVLDMDDPEIMNYPVVYVSEPGYWNCTQEEVTNLREYLDRGGFIIFDDFRDSRGEWENFARCMQQVAPGRVMQQLSNDEPIFHCFYNLSFEDMPAPYNVPGDPVYYGLVDDDGRVQVIANFNNDIGDYWEWSDQSLVPIALSNEAYKFGINYVIYALTH